MQIAVLKRHQFGKEEAPRWHPYACSRTSCAAWAPTAPLSNHRSSAQEQKHLYGAALNRIELL